MQEVTLENRLEARHSPIGSPIMYQEWRHLLFLHWEWDKEHVQKLLPPGLFVDTYQEKCYVGIVPLFMPKIQMTKLPFFPALYDYIEVNVRTYVYDRNGIPGVWFFSLDINSRPATMIARQFFSLPYQTANLTAQKTTGGISLQGKRTHSSASSVAFEFNYKPQGESFLAKPDSLEFFLVERYVLFAFNANELSIQRIHHHPYPLYQVASTQTCEALFLENGLTCPANPPDHQIFSSGVNVDIFGMQKDRFFESKGHA